jgi:hypothetical protein
MPKICSTPHFLVKYVCRILSYHEPIHSPNSHAVVTGSLRYHIMRPLYTSHIVIVQNSWSIHVHEGHNGSGKTWAKMSKIDNFLQSSAGSLDFSLIGADGSMLLGITKPAKEGHYI